MHNDEVRSNIIFYLSNNACVMAPYDTIIVTLKLKTYPLKN
jgi:hypothetical protein